MAVRGGLTNSYEKKRSEKQRRKGKIFPSECTAAKQGDIRKTSKGKIQRNRRKQ